MTSSCGLNTLELQTIFKSLFSLALSDLRDCSGHRWWCLPMLCIKPLTWDTAGKLSFESNHVSFVSFSFFSRLIFSSIKCLLYKALLACFQCKALNESIENQFLEEEIHTIVFFNIYLLLSCCITTNIRIFHQHNNEMPFLTHTMLVNTDIIFTTDQNHSI